MFYPIEPRSDYSIIHDNIQVTASDMVIRTSNVDDMFTMESANCVINLHWADYHVCENDLGPIGPNLGLARPNPGLVRPDPGLAR